MTLWLPTPILTKDIIQDSWRPNWPTAEFQGDMYVWSMTEHECKNMLNFSRFKQYDLTPVYALCFWRRRDYEHDLAHTDAVPSGTSNYAMNWNFYGDCDLVWYSTLTQGHSEQLRPQDPVTYTTYDKLRSRELTRCTILQDRLTLVRIDQAHDAAPAARGNRIGISIRFTDQVTWQELENKFS